MDHVKRWLQLVALAHVALGLLLPAVVATPLVEPYFQVLAGAFAVDPVASADLMRFLIGVFGPTVASWGVLFGLVVTLAFAHPTRQAWRLMVVACLVWALYDSIYSTWHGLWIHGVLNGTVLVAILGPLWVVRREFR